MREASSIRSTRPARDEDEEAVRRPRGIRSHQADEKLGLIEVLRGLGKASSCCSVFRWSHAMRRNLRFRYREMAGLQQRRLMSRSALIGTAVA